MPIGWEWDETLYLGSAPYYARGRPPYAAGLADRLAKVLELDGTGRLIDVGCGPGILTLVLAPLFEEVVGVDPDAEMLAAAEHRAAEAGIGNARWAPARAEDLSVSLGPFRVATFGQSFHWMDRPRVAAIVFNLLAPGGAFVQVSDVKETRAAPAADLPRPSPPYDAIRALVQRYLGPVRRAGQGILQHGTPDGEAIVLNRAGFAYQERLRLRAAEALLRDADNVVAWVYSRSDSAPHLFGGPGGEFETELRRLLHEASPSGLFADRPPDTKVFVWRKP
ncbi:MAG TPA: class I SAM-dependent methyltransferase [Methylomirabilota bacterium]|nr:class I SAM-dependent methyltransferase [Methylomirabilota bacterium]